MLPYIALKKLWADLKMRELKVIDLYLFTRICNLPNYHINNRRQVMASYDWIGWYIRGIVATNKLLNTYCLSLDYPDVSGAEQLELLEIRDQISILESQLSMEERAFLFEADRKLLTNVSIIYKEVSRFVNLAEHRKNHNISPQKWWWYLDVLGNISNYLNPVAA